MVEEQRLVIMEGADGVGKTHIGRGVAKALEIPYFRMPSQHETWRDKKFQTALEFDQTYLVELLHQTNHSMVIDRAWPSEWVYSRVYGRPTNESLLESLDHGWNILGAWIIIPLRRSFEGVRGDDLVARDKLKEIQDTYLKFIEWTSCNVLSLYVDDPFVNCDLEEEMRIIRPELAQWNRHGNVKITYGRKLGD